MDVLMMIPKRISVGFNKRNDTYTGKLAYVVYYDEKGIRRKEKSWEQWRDKNIPVEEFDNVPTSGFVLNKKAGGRENSWSSWNIRQTYVRVYDPRGFEFEITIPNLLFILQECTSTKGKGLEGEFVYAWAGTELVLLPSSAEEYQKCLSFTDLKGKTVPKKELKEGHVYLTKKMEKMLYLGQHTIISGSEHWNNKIRSMMWNDGLDSFTEMGQTEIGKRLVFLPYGNGAYSESDPRNYVFVKDTKQLAEHIEEVPSEVYADEYVRLCNSYHIMKYTEAKFVPVPDRFQKFIDKINENASYLYGHRSNLKAIIEENGNHFAVDIEMKLADNSYQLKDGIEMLFFIRKCYEIRLGSDNFSLRKIRRVTGNAFYRSGSCWTRDEMIKWRRSEGYNHISKEEVAAMNFGKIVMQNGNAVFEYNGNDYPQERMLNEQEEEKEE